MTVLDMSKLVINGLGLKYMTERPGLFVMDPSIPEGLQKDAGTIALARVYGIMNPYEQNYNRKLTRGEAVQIIYDLLVYLREIQ